MAARDSPAHFTTQTAAVDDDPGLPLVIAGRRPPRHAAPQGVFAAQPVGAVALVGLRVSVGFLFLWAFTSSKRLL